MKLRSLWLLSITSAVLFLPLHALATPPLGAPNATLLLESEVLAGNQSNNLGPATNWVLNDFWEAGACPEGDSYGLCDILRFGAATFAAPPGSNGGECVPGAKLHIPPQEDGGAPVGDFISSNDISSHCNEPGVRPLADGLYGLQSQLFPGLTEAPESTKDSWFDHPHLTLAIISELPQDGPSSPGDQVQRSLKAACDLLEGHPGEVPPMPTWTMVARQHTDAAVPFAHLLSGAGGTGICCDTFADGDGCDPEDLNQRLDVCAHIDGRHDDQLRQDLADERYHCTTSQDSWATGALDFDTSGNNLPQITCHLNGLGPGQGNNDISCDNAGRVATDLFGKFSCIRQIPRQALNDKLILELCDASGCQTLSLANGDFEFVDASRTLISLQDEYCESISSGDGEVSIDPCPMRGQPCDTGNPGRCADGFLDCYDGGGVYCQQLHEPMPELCNGLDDSCDGLIDNTAHSLDELPDDYHGRACNGAPVCSCPNGPERAHYGHDLMSFIDGQQGLCRCIAPQTAPDEEPSYTPFATSPNSEIRAPDAGCMATKTSSAPAGFILLILVASLGIIRHRIGKTS